MTLIQFILGCAILLLMALYFRYFKSKNLNRLVFSLFFVAGLVFVAFPELTNDIAKLLGVGRGADLLLYVAVVTFSFAFILLYARIRRIEEIQTEILRQQAIDKKN